MSMDLLSLVISLIVITYTEELIYKLDKLIIEKTTIYYMVNFFLFISFYIISGRNTNRWLDILVASILYIAATIDEKYFIIPDKYFLIIFSLGFLNLLLNYISLADSLKGLGIFIMFFIFILITERVVKEEVLGGGDLKLFLSLGFFLGFYRAYLLLFFSHLLRLVIVAYKKIVSTSIKIKKEVPFGSYIYLGFVITIILENLVKSNLI